ncbi:MAG: cell division protein FtsA [Pontibacterium sp.]
MSTAEQKEMIVALDVGTSKVVCLVAEVSSEGDLQIVGVGEQSSGGLRDGATFRSLEILVQSIKRAISNAELMANCVIESAVVSVSGAVTSSQNHEGMAGVSSGVVTEDTLERAIESSKARILPQDKAILHILPQEYTLDNLSGVQDPIGMSCTRLDMSVHMVLANQNALQNIENCTRQCNVDIDMRVMAQLASAEAVLTDAEKELGVCLIDIGAGSADIAIFSGGSIRYSSAIAFGGDYVTHQLAERLKISKRQAEALKVKHASIALAEGDDETIVINSYDGRSSQEVSQQDVSDIVWHVYDNLFEQVLQEIQRSGYSSRIPAGVVLTGGASRIENLEYLAEQVIHAPARVASPDVGSKMAGVLDVPNYATVVGLLMYAIQDDQRGAQYRMSSVPEQQEYVPDRRGLVDTIISTIKQKF